MPVIPRILLFIRKRFSCKNGRWWWWIVTGIYDYTWQDFHRCFLFLCWLQTYGIGMKDRFVLLQRSMYVSHYLLLVEIFLVEHDNANMIVWQLVGIAFLRRPLFSGSHSRQSSFFENVCLTESIQWFSPSFLPALLSRALKRNSTLFFWKSTCSCLLAWLLSLFLRVWMVRRPSVMASVVVVVRETTVSPHFARRVSFLRSCLLRRWSLCIVVVL